MKIIKRFKLIKKLHAEGRAGDVGILKLDLFGLKGSPKWEDSVKKLNDVYPVIILSKLNEYPDNSLGKELYHFMIKGRITPFIISPDYQHLIKKNAFGSRILAMHDIYHVLLGFNTSYAGEMGVWSFQHHKGFSKGISLSYFTAKVLYPFFSPHSFSKIKAANAQGKRLATESKLDICFQYQDFWEVNIDELRQKLGISI